MITKKQPHWYTLNILPLYVEVCDNTLKIAISDLTLLQDKLLKPHLLNKVVIQNINNIYHAQKDNNWMHFEQCKRWRDESPNDDELRLIALIEKNAYQIDVINHQIITLVEKHVPQQNRSDPFAQVS